MNIFSWLNKFKPKNIFGVILATVLLFFYIITWGAMIYSVSNELKAPPLFLTEGFFYVATASAGIASALAIAILGATPPEKMPKFDYMAGSNGTNTTGILTMAYLLAWVVIGVLAVYHGLIFEISPGKDPKFIQAHQHLKVFGNTWFGMALSAVFVYFKLRPNSNPPQDVR